jgi:catechol 1,2-dioxygenase
MSNQEESRLQVVFSDLRSAIDDVILKHQVTPMELFQVIGWIQQVADSGELLPAGLTLFVKPSLKATDGTAYAHPELDGASHWEMKGPAHIPGSPLLPSPCVLPMRPDEPGEPLVVSGMVRSTSGEPLPGAIVDVWQPDANMVYSGMAAADFAPLHIPNDSTGIPQFNLRGRVVADSEGRYEYRTAFPGNELLGLKGGGPLEALAKALGRAGSRPRHIHSIVSADGHRTLITQLYFDGDPLLEGTIEGPFPPGAVKTSVLHDDPADYEARGLTVPYRTVTYDYILRPVTSEVPVPAAV